MICTIKYVNNFSQTIELELGTGRKDRLIFIGYSFWGAIYRSENLPAWYRLIPVENAPFEKRFKTKEWIKRPRKVGIAPIIETGQTAVQGTFFFYIRYEIHPDKTWADIIAYPDIAVRFEALIKILRAFPQWNKAIIDSPNEYFIPMPNDILFVEGTPYLLAMPFWGAQDIEAVFAVTKRGKYLAPEYVRGCREKFWGWTLNLYALGVSIWECFFTIPEAENLGQLLLSIANSTLLAPEHCKRRLPLWYDKVNVYQKMTTHIRSLINPDVKLRSGVDLLKLANQLEECRGQLDPETIITFLRASGKDEEAFLLIQDMLLDRPTYKLLLIAGEMAVKFHNPLESIDLFEQAIALDRSQPEAYEAQFKVLMANFRLIEKLVRDQSENRIWRDFIALPVKRQQENETSMATFLLYKQKYSEAAQFIYPRLFEGNTYLWWKFGLIITYARTIMELGQLEEVQQLISMNKLNLKKVRQNRSLSENEIHSYGLLIAELEVDLLKRRNTVI